MARRDGAGRPSSRRSGQWSMPMPAAVGVTAAAEVASAAAGGTVLIRRAVPVDPSEIVAPLGGLPEPTSRVRAR